ncbi:MAG: GAF domain-containing protein, partial [Thermoguttaceae bacterium]
LPDLTCDILIDMSLEDRKDILRQNIIRETTELLKYEVAEVRVLSEKDGELEPLLAIGMDEDAMNRKLYSRSEGNGITGYVAHTGKSYLCEDTTDDPFYVPGTTGMKSSMTVPLIHHGKVIGTFNVESPLPRAFTEVDLRFMEEFARDVAVAINTLDLLTVEKAETAAASIEAIHRAVALPIDSILNDAVYILARNSGMEPELLEKLRRIQANAREIKAVIQEVGRQMTPSEALPFPPESQHPLLWNANILVVDSDPETLIAVNEMLAKFGCNVESAPCAEPALLMVENNHYDAIVSEIKLKDGSGYVFLKNLQAKMNISPVPIVFTTEFGYDPGHTIVKTRAEGVDTYLVKPFKSDRLIATLETVISRNRVDVR